MVKKERIRKMINTIVVRPEETVSSREGYKSIYQSKIYTWIDEEFDKGWLIEILRFDFYNKYSDNNQYCDIEYRAFADKIHLEMLERLTTGL